MDQEATITLALGLALAGIAALWPVLTLGPGIRERLESRVTQARITLGGEAKETLRAIRVQLEQVFAASDSGEDQYLLKVDPEAVIVPAREYTKYVQISAGLLTCMASVQRRSRLAFVVLTVFVGVSILTVVATALGSFIGLGWAYWGLVGCAAVFVVGAVCFLRIVRPYRKIDAGIGLATDIRLARGDDSDGISS